MIVMNFQFDELVFFSPSLRMVKKDTNNNATSTELIDYPTLSKKLKLSRRSVENLVKNGTISRIKIGKSVRFNWLTVIQELENASNQNAA